MKKNFENWSKEELILEIEKLYKRKKYGLVWETKNNEEVVELCKKNIELFNSSSWDEAKAMMASTCGMHDIATGMKANDADQTIGYVQGWKSAFPDMIGTVDSSYESENTVIMECSWTGTHTGDMMTPDGNTIPPTNKTVNLKNVFITEFDGDKFSNFKNYYDAMTMMSQLGLIG